MDNVIYALVGLNIVQFLFWSYQNHILVNKLMCKNYAEYVQANGLKTKQTIQIKPEEPDEVIKELNGMFN